MALARSRITSQGQISVPAAVRKKLGLVPGSTLEWVEDGDRIVVQRTGKYTFEDIRKKAFGRRPPPRKTGEELREGVRDYIRERHARD